MIVTDKIWYLNMGSFINYIFSVYNYLYISNEGRPIACPFYFLGKKP